MNLILKEENLLKHLRKNAIWLNLGIILDRSIVDGVTLTDINTKCKLAGYQFKEAIINEYDEIKVNLATLLIINYYLLNGHKLVGKSNNETLEFVIHVHRGATAIDVNLLIERLIKKCTPGQFKASYKECEVNNIKRSVSGEMRQILRITT